MAENSREIKSMPSTTAHQSRLGLFGGSLKAETIENKDGLTIKNNHGEITIKNKRPGQKQASVLEWIFNHHKTFKHSIGAKMIILTFDPTECLLELGYTKPRVDILVNLLNGLLKCETTMSFNGHRISTNLISRHEYSENKTYDRDYEISLDARILAFIQADTSVYYPKIIPFLYQIDCGATQAIIRAIITHSPRAGKVCRQNLVRLMEDLAIIPVFPKDLEKKSIEYKLIKRVRNKKLKSVRDQFSRTIKIDEISINVIQHRTGVKIEGLNVVCERHPDIIVVNPITSKIPLIVSENKLNTEIVV